MAHLIFVCHGNICRSPMAERVAQQQIDDRELDITVESFAMSSEESGNPIDRRARKVLDEAGYRSDGHRARKISARDIAAADLVIAVEPHQVESLRRMAPDARVELLNDFNDAYPKGTRLIDPWYGDQDGFYDTLRDIEAAMPAILDDLTK